MVFNKHMMIWCLTSVSIDSLFDGSFTNNLSLNFTIFEYSLLINSNFSFILLNLYCSIISNRLWFFLAILIINFSFIKNFLGVKSFVFFSLHLLFLLVSFVFNGCDNYGVVFIFYLAVCATSSLFLIIYVKWLVPNYLFLLQLCFPQWLPIDWI